MSEYAVLTAIVVAAGMVLLSFVNGLDLGAVDPATLSTWLESVR